MLLGVWLQENTVRLAQAGITSARLDCLVLAEDVLAKDRSILLAHPELHLSSSHINLLNTFITQRLDHIPLAYIRGRVAFYGREFRVNKSVLIPRPETETLIEILGTLELNMPVVRMADIGTGSGCIGITAALEVSNGIVDFYDIDAAALDVAKHNADTYNVQGHFYISNILSDFHGPYDIILTNLPYVPERYPINAAAAFEPELALFSGADGLDHYRLLWQQIKDLKGNNKPSHILLEAFPAQHHTLRVLAQVAGFTQQKSEGFIQHFARVAPH